MCSADAKPSGQWILIESLVVSSTCVVLRFEIEVICETYVHGGETHHTIIHHRNCYIFFHLYGFFGYFLFL